MKTSSRTSNPAVHGSRGRRHFKAVESRLNPSGRILTTTPADSLRMSTIRQRGTTPELVVRRLVWSMGHRYRTLNADLPGSPDLANRSRRWAIFVHGCYWHAHTNCRRATVPRHNRAFWLTKFQRNVERDQGVEAMLHSLGFRIAVVWECETQNQEQAIRALRRLFPLPEAHPSPRRSSRCSLY